MKKLLTIGLLLLATSSAFAAPQPLQRYSKYGRVINGLDLQVARSFAIDLSPGQLGGTWGLGLVWITVVDANDSVTDIDMVCTSSRDGGTTNHTIQVCKSVSDGVCKSINAGWDKAEDIASISSPKLWLWRVDIEGLPNFSCTLTPTGGAAADLIYVDVDFATKG